MSCPQMGARAPPQPGEPKERAGQCFPTPPVLRTHVDVACFEKKLIWNPRLTENSLKYVLLIFKRIFHVLEEFTFVGTSVCELLSGGLCLFGK